LPRTAEAMPTLEIDGRSVTVADGLNLIQAAEELGIDIPHYCYHPGLSVAGNCRMCLVEVEKMPKLQIACNTRAGEGMIVRTASERVLQARRAVLEFLLINHPIDCPICDQAGECKLQDYYMEHDRQPSRFPLEAKIKKLKAVDIGPLVMLDQERCILCTRCTRFLDEVSKTGELGVFERGNHCMIDLFPGGRLENPYSGNVVDICPVGALTNKDFRFRARVWYLDRTRSVCPSCATGCNIDIDHRRGEIFRFRPRSNPAVNGYWMCDEGRLSYRRFQGEGRLLQPVRRGDDGWAAESWQRARAGVTARLAEIVEQHGPESIAGLVSAQATCEEMFLFRRWIGDALKARLGGFQWSAAGASGDDFLIDADKNPNSAGLRALGLAGVEAERIVAAASEGKTRGLVLLRADLALAYGSEVLDRIADRVDFLVTVDSHFHRTAEVSDVLLPAGSFAETDGTFVNRSGRVQRIREAFPPPGQAKGGWRIIAELLEDTSGEPVPADAAAVFTEMAAAVGGFGQLSYETIGNRGAPLEKAPAEPSR
jgi:NADH-quinone oxidoreductase subunit G